MELVRANAQSELTALERGMHALHSGMDGKSYASSIGRPQPSIAREISAARVAKTVTDVGYAHPHPDNVMTMREVMPEILGDLSKHFSQLVEIHAAPRWLWPALVFSMVSDGWTVEATRKAVAGVKEAPEPPEWVTTTGDAAFLRRRRPASEEFPWGRSFRSLTLLTTGNILPVERSRG